MSMRVQVLDQKLDQNVLSESLAGAQQGMLDS
jgi:hypothetical protein